MVTSSRYPAFDKNHASQSPNKQNAPCFNFFDKGCSNPNCNYSHDRNLYHKHLEKQLADSKAILSRTNHTVSHIAPSALPTSDIETGRDGGEGEQGDVTINALDTGQLSDTNNSLPTPQDINEKMNIFHARYAAMDNDEQLAVLNHVRHLQQQQASQLMYQQGYVQGRRL
jgi:hypothetical protein